jgi:hypothetical protein
MAISEGRFSKVESLEPRYKENVVVPRDFSEILKKKLLPHLSTREQFLSYPLLPLEDVLTAEVYKKWTAIRTQLDVQLNIYFYAISDTMPYVDIAIAWLIELMEPLSEYIEDSTKAPRKSSNGGKVTLRQCIEYLIEMYGKKIFKDEIKPNAKEIFLDACVNLRNRLMHVKLSPKGYFDGKGSILYSNKFQLLIRHLLFTELSCEHDPKYRQAFAAECARLSSIHELKDCITK